MRTSIFIVCCLAAVMFTTPTLGAQDTLPPAGWKQSGPQATIEQGLTLMIRGDMEQAFKVLFGKGHTKETLDKLKFELYSLNKKSGNPYAFERLIEQKAGTSVTRYRYLLLYAKQPVMFDFYYYKSKKGWILKNISYSKDIKKVFVR